MFSVEGWVGYDAVRITKTIGPTIELNTRDTCTQNAAR